MDDLDRVALVVTPKEPYLVWARSVEPDSPPTEVSPREFGTVYLVRVADEFNLERVLRKHFTAIFEEELASWYRDVATWPRRRTYRVFQKWFDVQLMELVFDLSSTEQSRRRT